MISHLFSVTKLEPAKPAILNATVERYVLKDYKDKPFRLEVVQ